MRSGVGKNLAFMPAMRIARPNRSASQSARNAQYASIVARVICTGAADAASRIVSAYRNSHSLIVLSSEDFITNTLVGFFDPLGF